MSPIYLIAIALYGMIFIGFQCIESDDALVALWHAVIIERASPMRIPGRLSMTWGSNDAARSAHEPIR